MTRQRQRLIRAVVIEAPLLTGGLLVCALIVYGVAGWIGWEGAGRVLIALCAGPFLGLAVFGVFWLAISAQTRHR